MLGYTAEQLLSMNWRDLTHPADIALNEAEHQRLQESDSPPSGTVEKRYLRSNGEVIWVLLSLAFVRDEAGDPVYSIAHSVDITERKMRETSRAADAERRFRIAFENAPIAMCLTDPDGRFLQVNPAMCEMFQYSHEQLCEFSWADLSHPDDVDESQSVIRRLLNAPEGSVEIESRFVRSDSQIVVASLRISAAGAGDGSDRYHIGQIVNLTDLRRSHQRLEELLSSKNEFIASVAHELRTPLTTVLGFAELLTDRELSVSPGERAEMIQSIVSEAADLTAIVEDLIVAARSENSDQTVAAVPVSLHAQIAQVIETYGPDFATRWHITGDPVKALADPTRVRQILRNLVNNALKYGGDDLRITSVADGHSSLVLVSDNGPGIPREERDLIFESYKRAHNARGMTGSLGLGLAVSRKLARLMGGDLTYRYQNERSVFALTLPAAPQD
jgi:PAS domain S-box-containing protein